eukprot:CAMPEP_0116150978 /NCGR_PEP_ID=MMETSP0329-20121206/19847_1 /TAXON_ID=697910 /ORGANISM="Pseudo-nitzschia arenysensis, Strain B593" /LENGTH=60 /DNA_ID=CAMNT_0003647551 /DNA_START=299 /DNA_END=481 /DNA_ORIENTATION=-
MTGQRVKKNALELERTCQFALRKRLSFILKGMAWKKMEPPDDWICVVIIFTTHFGASIMK